jgi:hypothetical protein
VSGLPLLFTAAGPITTPPAVLNATLIATVAAEAPGYTVLPGILISDMSGTATYAIATQDQARVDAVMSVSPYTANAWILAMQGAMLGVPQGLPSNGSVFEVFTGSPGYVIPPGYVVGDDQNQYSTQDGGIVGSGGTSPPIFFVATNSGTFAIPAGSVTTIIASVPSPYTLTVTNPEAGVPALAAQTIESYRAQVIQAQQGTIQGWLTQLKTQLQLVPGVNPNLVSVIPNGSLWTVICGGGDPYQVAYAIYQGVSSISLLAGSQISSLRNIEASIYDVPDTYNIVYVNPPQVTTTVAVTWNTVLSAFTAGASVDQLIIGATLAYINGIIVGQPINLLVLTELIQAAVTPVLLPINLTTLTFVVTMNSFVVTPTAGTSIIPPPDVESYLFCSATGATSVQG